MVAAAAVARDRRERRERLAAGEHGRQLKLGVAELAVGPVGAHARQVLWARLLARVPVAAARAVLAEAARKPRALVHLVLGPQVEEDAVLVRALAKVGEEPVRRGDARATRWATVRSRGAVVCERGLAMPAAVRAACLAP